MESQEGRETIRILIAEDDARIGDLLAEVLRREGREIVVVEDGLRAVEAMEEAPFDILVTDLNMPGMGGLELMRRAKERNPHVLVIIVTGYASLDSAIQAVKEGAYDYIRKPFKVDELQISVDNACDKIMLFRENQRLLERLREQEERCREHQDAQAQSTPEEPAVMERLALHRLGLALPLPSVNSSPYSTLEALERLGRLRKEGVIDDQEFALLKRRLMV